MPGSTVQRFVEQIIKYFKEKCSVTLIFTVKCWFFPRLTEESPLSIVVITVAKVVIFKSKYKECHPNMQHFLHLIKLEAEKEERSAERKNMLETFTRKWGDISQLRQASE